MPRFEHMLKSHGAWDMTLYKAAMGGQDLDGHTERELFYH